LSRLGVDEASLRKAFERAGLCGQRAVVHSSLGSLGHVEGGAPALTRALCDTLETLVVPTFSWGEGSAECRAPEGEGWLQNGQSPGDTPGHVPVPFEPAVTPPVRAMGAVPRAVLRLSGVERGSHPLTSFAAIGAHAARYVSEQRPDDPQFPLKQLEVDDGFVVLLGVNLTRCTALHVAEERVGRRPFVRWALSRAGVAEPVRVGGCSEGFERLWPGLSPVFSVVGLGQSQLRIARLSALVSRAAELLAANASITHCPLLACVRCRDALLGGPVLAAA